jgi:hypothetical protein
MILALVAMPGLTSEWVNTDPSKALACIYKNNMTNVLMSLKATLF